VAVVVLFIAQVRLLELVAVVGVVTVETPLLVLLQARILAAVAVAVELHLVVAQAAPVLSS
jgi:hypothetical protein